MNFAVYYTILIALCISTVESQSCQANDTGPGTCLSLYDCRHIVNLIRDGFNRVADFDNHFSVCLGHGDGRYICCPNIHTATTASSTTSATPTDLNIGSGISANSSEDVPEFGKIEDVSNHPNLNLLPKNCGRISFPPSEYVHNTAMGEFRFLALLGYETSNGLIFSCGGTIINERYILTAAHCVNSPIRKLVSVRVGEHFLSPISDCVAILGQEFCAPPEEDIEVEEIIQHPRYNRRNLANNIALIRLRSDINFNNSNLNAVCLPINNETLYAPLNYLIGAGWNHLLLYGPPTGIPLTSRMRLVDHDRCKQLYGSIQVLASQICACGVNQILVDTCQGDSGGVLFNPAQLHKSLRYVQYGILSACHSEGGDNIPNIYTKISHYMKWILDQLKQ